MEKLIELLNEYGKEHFEKCTNSENDLRIRKEICTEAYDEEVIISKRFGFIKWLVDNDKIDFESENYPLKKYYPYFNDDVLAIVSQDCNTYEDHCRVCYDKYESLLMLLAISDSPLEFLCKILK